MDFESAHHKAYGHMKREKSPVSVKIILVRLFRAWLVAFHVFPARMRETVERLLLIRQRQGLFHRYSGLKCV
jgi:hypothetical protein